jgi:hypothetical protein
MIDSKMSEHQLRSSLMTTLADNARLRAELSAAKEAEAAAQLAVAAKDTWWANIQADFAGLTDDSLRTDRFHGWDWLEEIRPYPGSPPTPTVEKVRRLVEALVDFRKAKAFLGADDYDNGPEVRGMFQHADAKADLALSEVEALIRTPQQSKGG